MKKISLIILGLALLYIPTSKAQQLSSHNMYHLNRYLYNPATAGTKPYTFVSCAYTQNWSGIEGAPNLQSLNAHSLISERVAIGGKIFYDNTGLSGKFGTEATYAYHLPISTNGTKMSFGVSALLTQHNLFKDKFNPADADDEVITDSENSVITPDASFGMSVYQDNKFYVDMSVHQLFNRQVSFINDDYIENKQVRHYFLGLGYKATINSTLKLEPSALLKTTESFLYQADLGLKAEIKDILSLGCYYRTDDAIITFIGIDTKNIAFGYSFGIITNDISSYSTGSHEIMLILKINNSKSSL